MVPLHARVVLGSFWGFWKPPGGLPGFSPASIYTLHTKGEVAKSTKPEVCNHAAACTMTTQILKIGLVSSIALKSRLLVINLRLENLIGQFKLVCWFVFCSTSLVKTPGNHIATGSNHCKMIVTTYLPNVAFSKLANGS